MLSQALHSRFRDGTLNLNYADLVNVREIVMEGDSNDGLSARIKTTLTDNRIITLPDRDIIINDVSHLSGDTLPATITASSIASLGTQSANLNMGGYSIVNVGSVDMTGITTDHVAEGTTHLYYTDTRARAALAGYYEVPLTIGSGLNRSVNTITVDTSTIATQSYVTGLGYITGNQNITLSGDVTGTGTTSISTTIANGAVSLAKMAQLSTMTIIGNNTGISATPLALTGSQVKTILGITQADVSGLTSSSTPTFGGLTLNGALAMGTNSITCGSLEAA